MHPYTQSIGESEHAIGIMRVVPAAEQIKHRNEQIANGILRVYDTEDQEIAALHFTRQGTQLVFPDAEEFSIHPSKNATHNLVFFDEDRFDSAVMDLAKIIAMNKHSRPEMIGKLCEYGDKALRFHSAFIEEPTEKSPEKKAPRYRRNPDRGGFGFGFGGGGL